MIDSPKPPHIETADIDWQSGIPVSCQFGDVYFSRENGLAETRYVFVEQNHLPERFAKLKPSGSMVVAETGFGTGLNFLATWQAWREANTPDNTTLHFISVERFPLAYDDLNRSLELWPELKELALKLLDQYPPPVFGPHRLTFDGGSVRLTLFFGDVKELFDQLRFSADAWFLDGFAPAQNPQMWADQVIGGISHHSHSGTTLATFTSAGMVRRALAEHGFDVTKVKGFGKKREMVTARLRHAMHQPAGNPQGLPLDEHDQTVAIIGSGIAGCTLANNLAQRGIHVLLIDQASSPARGASGNPQGALYVKLGVDFNEQTQLALSALIYSQRFYRSFAGQGWHPSGLLQLACDDKEQDRQRRFFARNRYPESILKPVSKTKASERANIDLNHEGIWFPRSGWLEPDIICKTLSDHPMIELHMETEIVGLQYNPDLSFWRLLDSNGQEFTANKVVICGGHRAPELIEKLLPAESAHKFKSIRGQVSLIPETEIHPPSVVISGPRYLNPSHHVHCLAGATFDIKDSSAEVSLASHEANLKAISQFLPSVLPESSHPGLVEKLKGRVAFRCTTHDYQPAAGELPDYPGLYLFTGLGSKGLSYAPLLAEFLGDRITGQPECLPEPLIRRVRPERCLIAQKS